MKPIEKTKKFATTLCLFILIAITPAAAYAVCQVTLEWDPTIGANLAGYRLYARQANNSYDYDFPVWQGSDTRCTIENLDENAVYYFVVRAFDGNDVESGDSNEVSFSLNGGTTDTGNAFVTSDAASGGGASGGCFIQDLFSF